MVDEKKTIWVVVGRSESGDDYGPKVFQEEPTDEELKALALSWDVDGDGKGPGDYGTYIHIKIKETEVDLDG